MGSNTIGNANCNSYAMGPPSFKSSPKDPKKPFDISNLMSPPEAPPLESFGSSSTPRAMDHTTSEIRRVGGPNAPLSPPISPMIKVDDLSHGSSPSVAAPSRDPILYPAQEVYSPPQQPLFAADESLEAQRIVDNHVVARPRGLFAESPPPRHEDYELALSFKSEVMKKYHQNPRNWLERERAQPLEDRRAGARHNQVRQYAIVAAKPQPVRVYAQRVVKPAAPKEPKPAAASSVPRPIRSNPPAERPTTTRRVSATPDPGTRRVVAPNREDKDFNGLPDFCPPLTSLPPKSNSLKVDWKGAPIDLSNDPHRHLLHADEPSLAANLRLDCATYLTSKRRMFVKRLECLRIGKEFRKTDAQQACKIDVNKASKLWTAFDRVGWLDKQWVARFM